MKIAILTPTFSHDSGIDHVAESQAIKYSKEGHKVTVFALSSGITPRNYKVIVIGMPKNRFAQRLYRLFFFLDKKKVSYYKKLNGFDKVISHFYPMNILASMAKNEFGVRYVYHNHGINLNATEGIFERIYMRLFLFFSNITLKNVDEAYSVSKFLKSDLKKVSGIESKVKYNDIDKKKFNTKVSGRKIRKKYGLENKKVLLFVGRIAPHKGVHLLLNAFSIAKKSVPELKLMIVGSPTFSSYFKKIKKSADSDVIFTGFIPEKSLPEYYSACDIYVTASLWEGFDLPVAEVQECGKKVVAFDVGSHKEVVKKGLLVKKGDVGSFAKSIVKLIKK